MASTSGQSATKVTSADISSIGLLGAAITSQGDVDGTYQITVQHNAGNLCDSSGITLFLKDNFAWTHISAEFWTTGAAACWSYMNSPGYGQGYAYLAGDGNMLMFNASLGDTVVHSYLAQLESQFISHDWTSACDNDANNFMRYNTTTFRKFTMVRRRNVNGSLAGIMHGRACNEIGANAVTIIKNIRIWN
jgi:hypothetical protein